MAMDGAVGGWYSRGGGGQRYSPPGDGVSMFANLQFAELAVTMSTFFMHMNSFLVRGEVFFILLLIEFIEEKGISISGYIIHGLQFPKPLKVKNRTTCLMTHEKGNTP